MHRNRAKKAEQNTTVKPAAKGSETKPKWKMSADDCSAIEKKKKSALGVKKSQALLIV